MSWQVLHNTVRLCKEGVGLITCAKHMQAMHAVHNTDTGRRMQCYQALARHLVGILRVTHAGMDDRVPSRRAPTCVATEAVDGRN